MLSPFPVASRNPQVSLIRGTTNQRTSSNSSHTWRQTRNDVRNKQKRQIPFRPPSATSTSRISTEDTDHNGRNGIEILKLFDECSSTEKLKLLLEAGRKLPPAPSSMQSIHNRVMGCTTRTYLTVDLLSDGCVSFNGTSDSEITKGLIALLIQHLSGMPHETVLSFDPTSFSSILDSPSIMTPSRSNGFLNLVETLKRKTRTLLHDFPLFPSLIITSSELIPQGSFAEAQAQYLRPNRQGSLDVTANNHHGYVSSDVEQLCHHLKEKKIGIVAHFYMDPEVQGVLSAASEFWEHIHISDSLLMADRAVNMAEAGCRCIAVLGVDFMSENVRVILDKAGHTDIQVFRMSSDPIGCSLAEAASSVAYTEYLSNAASLHHPTLHVIYINTALSTKAMSQTIVPTITCTSSNVIQTVLQAFAQVENLRVVYGPDTYMGSNIREMFQLLSEMSDADIQQLHPNHNRETIKEGTCIVHHLFGGDVCHTVRGAYGDAYIAAHFEVPGEMFGLAMEAKKRGMGIVGSTSNILDFIRSTVTSQISERTTDRLQFILGTESGMITSIVNAITGILNAHTSIADLEVEIVFPVASSAITTKQTTDSTFILPGMVINAHVYDYGGCCVETLDIIPGPAAGEGCSSEGGCANCPYMKMNSLHALYHVIQGIHTDGTVDPSLNAFKPQSYREIMKDAHGNDIVIQDLGCQPILEMRQFQSMGVLSSELVQSLHNHRSL